MTTAPELKTRSRESGSALIVALATMLVLSVVAASVLMNSTTRYNASYGSVKVWREALYAAEGGADAAFAEIRKPYLSSPQTPFATGWDTTLPLPAPQPNDWSVGYSNSAPAISFGTNNSLSARVTVDKIGSLANSPTTYYYRVRSIGTAQAIGFKRVGMDNALQASAGNRFANGTGPRGDGDSLLRKIDMNFDHFVATYGFGDALPSTPASAANGKGSVSIAGRPQVSRRVEIVAVPVMPIEGAVKTTTGSYSFPYIDSFDSRNGAYPGQSVATNPSSPYYGDARNGNVVDGSATFSGTVYGDVTTNGGNASKANVSGVIDNNVPIAPVPNLVCTPAVYETNPGNVITPPAVQAAPSPAVPADNRQKRTFWYHYTSISSGLTINPAPALDSTGLPSGGKIETSVNIVVDQDITGNVTVKKGVMAKIYFSGNISGKANSYVNNNVDGPGGNGVYLPNYTDQGASASPRYALAGYNASTNTSRADHLWFIGEGASQTINLGSASPSTTYAVWYAPNADFSTSGNPDFVGAAVVKSFSGNGNNTMHFDKELLSSSNPLDYRVASYVEDVR